MKIESLIEQLPRFGWYKGQIALVRRIPATPARYGELPEALPTEIQAYLHRRRIRLYSHQCRTIEHIREGKHTILATPTASGKTLAFNLPIFERLSQRKSATALFLYPLKALTNDQLRAIREIEGAIGVNFNSSIYDGDTPGGLRSRIRDGSRIILSNFHAIHQYLPWHYKWKRFFENLQFVVLDEAHTYRGVFGSNVAMVLRRLLRIAHFYGARPQFVLASGTIANPLEHAKRLTGYDFVLVDEDGAPHGERYFVFWNSKDTGESPHREASKLLAYHVNAGLQTLCFTGSRKMAELTVVWAKKLTAQSLAAYRAGFFPEERRRIEDSLREGRLRGVATTNALELGVDIGKLDSVIISGYPGTVISAWQQAGRAGRGAQDSLVMLVGLENALDQYFMRHPQKFFERPHEHAIVDLNNGYILLGHAMCAAAELPLRVGGSGNNGRAGDEDYLGPRLIEILAALDSQRLVQRTPTGAVYRGTTRPSEMVGLGTIATKTVSVVCAGKTLEKLEQSRAYSEAHTGAVLLHQGESYLVEKLDLGKATAFAVQADADFYTETDKAIELRVRAISKTRRIGDFALHFGNVVIREQVTGYWKMRYGERLTILSEPLDVPAVEFATVAFWFTLPDSLRAKMAAAGIDWMAALHAAEHALIATTPFYAMCDRRDIGGVSMDRHPDTSAASVFVYDGFPGGIGIAEKAFELFGELVITSAELIRDCPCEDGCPSCVYSPKCGSSNRSLDKKGALVILSELVQAMRE